MESKLPLSYFSDDSIVFDSKKARVDNRDHTGHTTRPVIKGKQDGRPASRDDHFISSETMVGNPFSEDLQRTSRYTNLQQ